MMKKITTVPGVLGIPKNFFIKSVALMAILIGMAGSVSAASCVQTGTATGLDSAPTVVNLAPTCQGPGVISAVSIDVTIGGACMFGWYSYKIIVNGVTIVTNQCDQTGFNLTPYLPITSISIESADGNLIPSTITLAVVLHTTYSANFCSGTPNAGNAYSSTPISCAGDTFDLSLSSQSTGLGFGYQWQSSPDNSTWTDMVNDTLLSVATVQSISNYYRCEMTCISTNLTDISTSILVQNGFCTPVSDTICSFNPGPTSETVVITGWQGIPISDGIVTFDYKGYLIGAPANYDLTVSDVLGNTYGVLPGGSVTCEQSSDEITIPQAQIIAMLAAGNGNIELILTSTAGMGVYCPTPSGTNASFCATATIRAASKIYENDASIEDLVTPAANQCVLDSNVSVLLTNDGSLPLTSATIDWEVNGVAQTAINWTGNIPSFTSTTVTLGVYTGGFSNLDMLKIWSSLPNATPDSNAVQDTINNVVQAAMNGTYVIDATGSGDFLDFNSAVTVLENAGLCGAVVFEVVDGTYVEQLTINTSLIGGISSVSTITFISQSGNASACELVYNASAMADNWVVKFENAQYLTFQNIRLKSLGMYSRVLFAPLSGNNQHITFDGCEFLGPLLTSSATNAELVYLRGMNNNNWTFVNNEFNNGSVGLYFGDNSPNYGDSNSVIGNQFINQYSDGVSFRSQHNPIVKDNYVTSISTGVGSAYGMKMSYLDGHGEVTNNHIEGTSVWPRYGMYLGSVKGEDNDKFLIAHNRIYVPGVASYRGLYMYGVKKADVVYNSIYKFGGGANTNIGMQLLSCDTINILNNAIQLEGLGYGIYWSGSGTEVISDYNAISGVDTNSYTGYFNGDTASTIAQWIVLSTTDSNSIELTNMYSDTASLLVCTDSLYGVGIAIPGMNEDFEGDPRQDPPCIGADEFMPLSLVGYSVPMELCTGDTLVLSQYYYDLVVWDFADTGNVFIITNTGAHSLSVFGECGIDTSYFNIIAPQQAVIGDTNLCEGTSAVLGTGISDGSYLWSTGSTDSTVTVSGAQIISVMVISAFGCESADTAIITQSTNVNLADDSVSFCEGANAVLDANMLGSYLWNNGSTDQIINVTTSGTYVVTVTEQNCISSDSTVVTEVLNPVTSFTESVNQNTVTFTNTSQNATTYDWDFGDGNTSTVENPVHTFSPPSSTWTYTVTLSATNDCETIDFEMDVSNKPNSIGDVALTNAVTVYPNPTTGIFNIEIENTEVGELVIEVLDVTGAVLVRSESNSVQGKTNTNLDITDFSTGVYLIKVTLNEKVALFRISKN